MKSFKELIAVQYPSQLVEYDQRKLLHRDALKRLVFDFLDIKTGDDESDKYLNNAKAYLLEKQGSYVAFLIYKPLDRKPHVAYIRAFGVDSNERRKSYGFTLLLGFIDACRRSGVYHYVQLAVAEENTAAIALYEQVGFKVVKQGEDEGRKFLCMELRLTRK